MGFALSQDIKPTRDEWTSKIFYLNICRLLTIAKLTLIFI